MKSIKFSFLLTFSLSLLIQSITNQHSAQIYLIDHRLDQLQTSTSNLSTTPTTTTTTISNSELNAILSFKLNISQFERLPVSLHPNHPITQLIFNHHPQLDDLPIHHPSHHPINKLIILIHAIPHDPQDLLSRSYQRSLTLPNPPDLLSFDALISTYIVRIVDSIPISIDSIYGLHRFLTAYHDSIGIDLLSNLADWSQDWSQTRDRWSQWLNHQPEILPITHPSSQETYRSTLLDYGPSDSLFYQLLDDLTILDDFIIILHRSIASPPPPISFLRLSSLQPILLRHGQASTQYRTAIRALRDRLSIILDHPSLSDSFESIVIGLPPQPNQARLTKRTHLSILSPFKTFEHSFIRRDLIDRRRSVFGNPSSSPESIIIPSSRSCFSTQAECQKSTDSCLGHGQCVQALSTSSGKCFACSCNPSKDPKTGKVTYWTGDRCEKQDLSSGFVLLLGSALGLIILFGLAIRLLSSIGSQGLPQQLASVSGSSKKMD